MSRIDWLEKLRAEWDSIRDPSGNWGPLQPPFIQKAAKLFAYIDELRAEVARLTAERDEARELVRGVESEDGNFGLLDHVQRWNAESANVLPVGPHPAAEFSETDSGSLDVPGKPNDGDQNQ